MTHWLGKGLQVAGLGVVGVVLLMNLQPEGLTMSDLLLLTGFGLLLFGAGTALLRAGE
ncbi:MAG: hypothetical protein ACE5FN_11820 [Leptospirillia bacterium]